MDNYGQFCPIARGAEVFAMRWTPLIVRNMLLGCRTFGEIREGLPGISKTLLSQRLSLLEHYGILERRPNPNGRGSLYELTTAGKELQAVTNSLGAWGSRWLDLAPAHFDAGIVLWALCKTVPADDLPAARTVIRFTLRDVEGTARVPVTYSGSVPDLFEVDRSIHLQGELRNGVFVGEADTLVTKCPSKYAPKRDDAGSA